MPENRKKAQKRVKNRKKMGGIFEALQA